MGERKGQNFYYPPDFNYKVHNSLNKYHGTHALRERAKKINEGILVIRFEMPFNVWCLGCNNHIGMGVRYNAEKKKFGMYYTTPLYEFRMKCHLCSNYFTIRTDPKNFDYEMVEGLRRQEKRFDSGELNNLAPVDRSFNQKLSADAMFKAEHNADDKTKLADVESNVAQLEGIQSRMYDDYTMNSMLRSTFRSDKKFLNEIRANDEDLKRRLSVSIDLQPASSEDTIMARRMLKYKDVKDFEEEEQRAKMSILQKPIFDQKPSTSSQKSNSGKPFSSSSNSEEENGRKSSGADAAKTRSKLLLATKIQGSLRRKSLANFGGIAKEFEGEIGKTKNGENTAAKRRGRDSLGVVLVVRKKTDQLPEHSQRDSDSGSFCADQPEQNNEKHHEKRCDPPVKAGVCQTPISSSFATLTGYESSGSEENT